MSIAARLRVGACGVILQWTGGFLFAQMGDRLNDDVQQAPPAEWNIPPAPVRTPAEALASFVVPPGFRIELVASEPLVQDPVAFAFDPQGRLYVAELPAYNAEIIDELPIYIDPEKARPQHPVGRIVRLEDTDGDGVMDRRVVFADNLGVPRSVAFFRDQVLVGDPPNLWILRDRDGDGIADERIAIADDYGTVPAIETSPNGLLWGRDNWLYNASYRWRLRFADGEWLRQPMPELGQYGITQDDVGRLFYNRNSDQLRGDLVSSHYFGDWSPPSRLQSVNVKIAADQSVFPIRPTPGVNRGYRKGFLREDGSLAEFTAASAPVLYRSGRFPAHYYGDVFVPEPASNSIKRNLLLEKDGRLIALNGFEQADFVSSTDERFRPVFLGEGPDGAIYVGDLYRGILESYNSITTYLKNQLIGRKLNQPLWGLGRIYRITYGPDEGSPPPSFDNRAPAALVALLSHKHGWVRDTAQRLIVESGDVAHVVPLEDMLQSEESTPRDKVYALWTLEGLSAAKAAILHKALYSPHPDVRLAALRVAEAHLTTPAGVELIEAISSLIETDVPIVAAQAVLTIASRGPAQNAIRGALPRAAEHPALVDAISLAYRGRESDLLDHLTALARGSPLPPFGHRVLFRTVGANIAGSGNRDAVDRLVAAINDVTLPEAVRLALVYSALPEITSAETHRRVALHTRLGIQHLELIAMGAPDLAARQRAEALIEAQKAEAARAKQRPPIAPLTPEQESWYQIGQSAYVFCAGCHQPDGEGREGVAPSLLNARWATHSSADLPLRIILHGKEGSPGFPGAMTPWASLSDEQISGVLTFIRRSWGNDASPVSPAEVARVREATQGRGAAWTDAELEALDSSR